MYTNTISLRVRRKRSTLCDNCYLIAINWCTIYWHPTTLSSVRIFSGIEVCNRRRVLKANLIHFIVMMAGYELQVCTLYKRIYREDRADFNDPFYKALFCHIPALIWPPISKVVGENVGRVFVRCTADFLEACNFESRGSQVYIPARGRSRSWYRWSGACA